MTQSLLGRPAQYTYTTKIKIKEHVFSQISGKAWMTLSLVEKQELINYLEKEKHNFLLSSISFDWIDKIRK